MKIVYDIQARDFCLPSLSLQPIVENAVKHGLRRKEGCGTVEIHTAETDEHFVVTICDDGVGFDPDQPTDNSRAHIGIKNVEKRLKLLCNGELMLSSKPGCGSTVIMQIPKENQA